MTNRKGFTITEVLLSLLIVSILMSISLRKINNIDLEHYEFINKYLELQSDAIKEREKKYLEGSSIIFSSEGHNNLAQTFRFKNHNVVATSGNGYVRIE